MDSIKTGQFIAKIRKEKNMTQKELAEKINVTDKAVSRWETGKGFPEITIIDSLAKELGVSTAEILKAGYLKEENIAEEEIIEIVEKTVDYSKEEVKKQDKKLKIQCITVIVILILLVVCAFMQIFDYMLYKDGRGPLFAPLCKREVYGENNENSIYKYYGVGYKIIQYESKYGRNDSEFGNWFLQEEKIDIDKATYDKINKYLEEKNQDNSNQKEDYKYFAKTKIMGIENIGEDILEVYLWSIERAYYREKGNIINDGGSSISYKIILKNKGTTYEIEDYIKLKNGIKYIDGVPESVKIAIDHIHNTDHLSDTLTELDKEIKEYYNKDRISLY